MSTLFIVKALETLLKDNCNKVYIEFSPENKHLAYLFHKYVMFS